MSRFILGNCIDIMGGFPDRAVDFILTDPPYLVGFRDRSGRTLAGDKTDEWLQPACNQMYRVLKKDALMVSFYGWNRVDRFMAAWKSAGFSVVGQRVSQVPYMLFSLVLKAGIQLKNFVVRRHKQGIDAKKGLTGQAFCQHIGIKAIAVLHPVQRRPQVTHVVGDVRHFCAELFVSGIVHYAASG